MRSLLKGHFITTFEDFTKYSENLSMIKCHFKSSLKLISFINILLVHLPLPAFLLNEQVVCTELRVEDNFRAAISIVIN